MLTAPRARFTHIAAGLATASLVWAGLTACATEEPLPGDYQLVFFDSCSDALAGLRDATSKTLSPYGLPVQGDGWGGALPPVIDDRGGPVAQPDVPAGGGQESPDVPAQPDHSNTNVHEVGVDEPDLVKTDGRRIVTLSEGRLTVVDVATHRVVGMVDLVGTGEVPWVGYDAQLLLAGDHALVLSTGYGYGVGDPRVDVPVPPPMPAVPDDPAAGASGAAVGNDTAVAAVPATTPTPGPTDWPVTGTNLVLVDLTTPRVLSNARADGWIVDARQVGSMARVVLRSAPRLEFPVAPGTEGDRIAANRAVINAAGIEAWAPRLEVTTDGQTTRTSVACDAISRPATYTGSNLLTVLSFDAAQDTLGDGSPVSIVADGETVYSTRSSLYVASSQGWMWDVPALAADVSQTPRTEIYRFDISGAVPRYVAGGSVPGSLLNQYSMSEWDSRLRVATTSDPMGGPDTIDSSQSGVYVLATAGDRLAQIGAVEGLGRGERIYAVRFVGPVGYVVTFRQMDPLYTVDLHDPGAPALRGELHIPGYSAYLHPAGDDRLIGVGQDATSAGQVLGLQVSLFDVADLTEPALLSRFTVPGGWSEAEADPHAFLYRPQTGLLVVPLNSPYGVGPVEVDGPTSGEGGDVVTPVEPTAAPQRAAAAVPQSATGALILRVNADQIVEIGFVEHPTNPGYGYPTPIRRSLVTVDEAGQTTLWTLSAEGLMATDATSLAQLAWIQI